MIDAGGWSGGVLRCVIANGRIRTSTGTRFRKGERQERKFSAHLCAKASYLGELYLG